MPTVNPNNAVVPSQDPNRQQQKATETSPLAGNNFFSQQFANQLSPGNNLFSQQFANQLSNLLHQFIPLTPAQQNQAFQSNQISGTTSQSPTGSNEVLVGRDQLTDSNSQPLMPETSCHQQATNSLVVTVKRNCLNLLLYSP